MDFFSGLILGLISGIILSFFTTFSSEAAKDLYRKHLKAKILPEPVSEPEPVLVDRHFRPDNPQGTEFAWALEEKIYERIKNGWELYR